MHSMTGFGRGSADFESRRVVLEIKTVNHRFLEVRCHAPRELLAAETHVERLLRKKLNRGYCTVKLSYEGSMGGATEVDKGALKAHLESLVEVGKDMELCLADLIPAISSAPDLYRTPEAKDEKALLHAVEKAFEQAAKGLVKMRKSEGEQMAGQLAENLKGAQELLGNISKLADDWPQLARDRLLKRIDALTQGVEKKLDEGRLESEVALLVDKADVTEEITRLKSHCDQFQDLVGSDGAIGRNLEFLIQEMGREVNTIGAKTALAEMANHVVEFKTTLEKMREMSQNVE